MAFVLSSISGNLISAASAGFAPTNSADVSAIASAYQVVSSTATQLYAGTAYVTSVNDAPISASRAGNAANASLANSAWYDGTGRLISALPDSAAVSAIASSYVESGVSSKQDTLSFAYNTADQISSINGSALGGMDEAAVSGIASAYAESAVSGKADSSALSSYALSADVSGTVDLVSTQSANWGGSALALSAGPGVKLEKVGDTLVASTDETLLWSGDLTGNGVSGTASEAFLNFENLKIYGHTDDGVQCGFSTEVCLSNVPSTAIMDIGIPSNNAGWGKWFTVKLSGNVFNNYIGKVLTFGTNNWNDLSDWGITKIVGINRTAEA